MTCEAMPRVRDASAALLICEAHGTAGASGADTDRLNPKVMLSEDTVLSLHDSTMKAAVGSPKER